MATLTKELVSKSGGLVSSSLVKREVKWIGDGVEHGGDVFVKPLSFKDSRDGITTEDQWANKISSNICDESGNPIFSRDDVFKMSASFSNALITAIGVVSGAIKDPYISDECVKTETRTKSSAPKKKSSTS